MNQQLKIGIWVCGTLILLGGWTAYLGAQAGPLPVRESDGASFVAVATAAKQDTGNTSLGTLAGAVSGTEFQVDIVGALPAGAAAIGKLAANSGVDIGDVDVTSISAGDNNIGNVDIASGTVTANQGTELAMTSETVTIADADGAQVGIAIASVSAGSTFWTDGAVACASEQNTVSINVRVACDTDTTLTAASTTGVTGELLSHPRLGPGACTPFVRSRHHCADDEDIRYSVDDPIGGAVRITVTYRSTTP